MVLLAVAIAPRGAEAGGLARPNQLSARGLSLGGAFVAVADDATAWHFNPSGTAFASPGIHLGAELVIAPRVYTPIDAAGVRGEDQAPKTPIIPLPALGVVARVSDRVMVGGGVWNTYGGQLTYPKVGLLGVIDHSQNAVIEVVGGVGYKVTERFSIGATLRLGVGLFTVQTTQKPVNSDLSAKGVGVGASLGGTWRASDKVTLAAAWRSGLEIKTTGSGELLLPDGPLAVNVEHLQTWPQSASVGAAMAVGARLRWSVELDWTQWSRYESLDVTFPGNEAVNQSFPLDWTDNYAVRSGLEWRKSPGLALRGGAYFDSSAIPDLNIERQYLDRDKVGIAIGAGIGSGAWRFDLGGDFTGGASRTVPDNSAEVGDFNSLENAAPGEYSGLLFSFELAAIRRI